MNTRPTPETDDATLIANDIEHGGNFNAVHVQVSKRLERERDEARETVEALKATALSRLISLSAAKEELAEARGQRDRLAEALEHTMKHMRHSLNCPARLTEGLHACNCQMEWAYDNATEALQSLTPNDQGEAQPPAKKL